MDLRRIVRANPLPAMLLAILIAASLAVVLAKSAVTGEQQESGTTSELTGLLRQFLVNAARGDRAGFERFFADDVIYTRSNGLVTNKADILKGLEKLELSKEMQTSYSAEDIVVHDYGDTAVIAFRLVAQTLRKDKRAEIMNYRNTGTFLRRNGTWQVVAWQSTRAPEEADAAKQSIR